MAAKRKQISISGGGDIWRGPGTANSKLTASCHQRPGPNSLPAFYFCSSSSTWTWLQCVCFADSALNRFSIGFPSGPAAKCIGAVFPPTHHFRHCLESCDLLQQERKYLRCMYWISICRDQNVLMRSLLRSTNKQGCYLLPKKGADDDLRLEGAPPKGSHH